VSVYLKNRDNTVKLFSHSFFKLDDLSEQENSVALLTGKSNFSIKPLPESSGGINEESQNNENKKDLEKPLPSKLGGKLKGTLTKLVRTKSRTKKKRFKVRTVSGTIRCSWDRFCCCHKRRFNEFACIVWRGDPCFSRSP
jgi:hypothetical protein